MTPLIEMLTQGANGQMIDQFARQYGLSVAQTRQAMEALMPAFSQGLKRNAADPMGFMAFLQALSGGQHANYYDDPARAFAASGMQEGNAILGHLFGSKELSRAVAAQAAQATGISQSILKAMLPALAPTIMGGLYKQLSEAAAPQQARAGGMSDNPLGRIFEQMTGGAGSPAQNPWGEMFEQMMGGRSTGGSSAGEAANPWGRMFEQMMGGGAGRSAPQKPPADDNPLGRIFEDMLRGGMAARGGVEPDHDNARGNGDESADEGGPPEKTGGFDGLFGEMFEAGRTMQKDYQKNVESIFDQFLSGMQKPPR